MSLAYLDSHVAVWLHDGLLRKLTKAAEREIERNEIRISPMAYLEFEYLFQRGRIRVDAATLYSNLSGTFGIAICPFPFPATAIAAAEYNWTNDPFDRIIVGHARANRESILITADESIREHYHRAVW